MPDDTATLDRTFHALSDATRRGMVGLIARRGECSAGELGEPFEITKPAVTKHVKVLERAGLLRREIDGRIHRCRVDPRPLTAAERWVAKVRAFWEDRFDDLAAYLETQKRHAAPKPDA